MRERRRVLGLEVYRAAARCRCLRSMPACSREKRITNVWTYDGRLCISGRTAVRDVLVALGNPTRVPRRVRHGILQHWESDTHKLTSFPPQNIGHRTPRLHLSSSGDSSFYSQDGKRTYFLIHRVKFRIRLIQLIIYLYNTYIIILH